jgi:GNAT superfamily N-acetyltransferase
MYKIKQYPKDQSYHHTFFEVLSFLNIQNEKGKYTFFHWSRFEWMFARASFKQEELSQITLFYKNEALVGMLIFEDEPGVFFVVYEDDSQLKKAIVDYLFEKQINDDLIIPNDLEMIKLLEKKQYMQTDWIDPVTRFSIDKLDIPETPNYKIISLAEDYRLDQIHYALWRGFNHGDHVVYSEENLQNRKQITSSPNFRKQYTYVAIHENQFVSYAGIWYMKGTHSALIEPVATVPEHRQKSLARSCIYHAIMAARKDGATDIYVGSNRSVYLNMGFKPYDFAIRFKKK